MLNGLLADFLSEWYGVLAFVIFDVFAALFIVAVFYRLFFKRVFDFLVSLVCILALSPLLIYMCVRARNAKKRGETDALLHSEPFVGKKGKTVYLHRFAGVNGKGSALARLFDLFLGKISVIGYLPLTEEECETLSEIEYDRHITKPGLIHPFSVYGVERENMLKADEKYAWSFSFFGDMKIFFTWLIKKIRGQN